jgi:hypothetical protein
MEYYGGNNMVGELIEVGLRNTACIAVNKDGCFKLLPTSDGEKPREYYRPIDVEDDYRALVSEFGKENVKLFREIEAILR